MKIGLSDLLLLPRGFYPNKILCTKMICPHIEKLRRVTLSLNSWITSTLPLLTSVIIRVRVINSNACSWLSKVLVVKK